MRSVTVQGYGASLHSDTHATMHQRRIEWVDKMEGLMWSGLHKKDPQAGQPWFKKGQAQEPATTAQPKATTVQYRDTTVKPRAKAQPSKAFAKRGQRPARVTRQVAHARRGLGRDTARSVAQWEQREAARPKTTRNKAPALPWYARRSKKR